MATIDNDLIGSVINALPLDRMIAGPLLALVQAQVAASQSYADFLMGVCVENGKAVAIEFGYDETVTDEQGAAKGTVSRSMRIPLMAAIAHPNIVIEEGNFEFEVTISQQLETRRETAGELSGAAPFGFGKFKIELKGQVSHKSTQTRKTDTRARYAFNTKVRNQAPPEALMRVIDALTEVASKPITVSN
ncbi:DUF2589 domain-containing protein [Pseudomonas vranovensis]|uniref:DUF2589 domain-containing protein n=1 Tax=Pseudomonas vranovensis TaxID=321661 RepID=A0A423CYY7_9PSED|nr:DUF2589 domain-containing protein [Pseudomonas vranovensis]ROL64519.1 hypothetical protein BHU25_21795 [Pseudomonas vranovensis]